MSSAIDPTLPADGTPASKQELRDNLAAAKAEIEALQTALGDLQTALAGKVPALNGANGVWVGSQAEYDAIGAYDAKTLYVVTG